jgi:hypothetical protein
MLYNYEYFSGANVIIYVNNKELLECAGLSYSVQNSQQPIYGYGSTNFDAILPGREIIQGNFVINFTSPGYLFKILDENNFNFNLSQKSFDIKIRFGPERIDYNKVLENCFLVSMGQTVQISEQVILEEYSFIARKVGG